MTALRPKDILNYRWRGVIYAVILMVVWACTLLFGLFGPINPLDTPLMALPLLLLEIHLFAGLFITAHDAMHGLIAPGNRTLNDFIGSLSLFLYAFFSYEPFHRAHHQHHAQPGTLEDPDYCHPANPNPIAWFIRFMGHYAALSQICAMGSALTIWTLGFGVPIEKAVIFWVAPALLAALSLFVFGTYLPHRPGPDEAHAGPHKARSNSFPPWLSYITCFHFGYHLEHHSVPFAPWWRLPLVRRARLQAQGTPRPLPQGEQAPV